MPGRAWMESVKESPPAGAARPRTSTGVRAGNVNRSGAHEGGDRLAEPFSGVLLEEVPGALDRRVLDALRAGNRLLEHRGHAPGDRVLVAEGHEERLVPRAEDVPGVAVGLRLRVVGIGRDEAGHGARARLVRLVGEGRVVGGAHLVRKVGAAPGRDAPRDVELGRLA